MNDPPDREVTVFNEALQLPAAQRAEYLDEACDGDAALRRRVDALLQAHQQAGAFLQEPTSAARLPFAAADPRRPRAATHRPAALAEKPGPRDHVFQLSGSYKMSGVGQTRFELQPDGSKHRGMMMRVQARALLDARNAELRASPHYKSPESIAAHELGHAAGLDDLETDQSNLMSHGRMHDKREIKVEQLKTIVREFQKGHLNKRLE